MSAVTLMHCENGWIALPQIIAGVAADLDLSPEAFSPSLQMVLEQFESMGLLECTPQ